MFPINIFHLLQNTFAVYVAFSALAPFLFLINHQIHSWLESCLSFFLHLKLLNFSLIPCQPFHCGIVLISSYHLITDPWRSFNATVSSLREYFNILKIDSLQPPPSSYKTFYLWTALVSAKFYILSPNLFACDLSSLLLLLPSGATWNRSNHSPIKLQMFAISNLP